MRYHAYSLTTSPDKTIERDILRCCHCQVQWYVQPGSGNTRGWCSLCNQPTCGKQHCQSCIPFMRKIELQESRERFLKSLEE